MRDNILERSKILKGSGICLEKDYDRKTRETRTQLKSYMKEARINGKHAVLKADKLVIEGRDFDLEFCKIHMGNDGKGPTEDQQKGERTNGTRREEISISSKPYIILLLTAMVSQHSCSTWPSLNNVQHLAVAMIWRNHVLQLCFQDENCSFSKKNKLFVYSDCENPLEPVKKKLYEVCESQ